MNCIELKDISLSYKKHQVLSNLNLSVPTGTVFALIGYNGSGKTSLLKIIAGLLSPSCGKVSLFGEEVNKHKGNSRAAFVLEPSQLDNTLTAYQNLRLKCCIYGISYNEINSYMEMFNISAKNELVKNLSKGMKQRIEIALALIGNPDLLVLDEVFNSLDINGVDIVKNIIATFKVSGKTVLIADHNFSLIEKIADYYAVLYDGHIVDIISAIEIGNCYDNLEHAYKECVKNYEKIATI